MANDKLRVYVASYATLALAEADWKALKSEIDENDLLLRDAAVLERDGEGHISIKHDMHHPVGKGAAIGGVLALVTPVGLLVGVLGGAAAGKLTEMLHHGFSKGDLRKLARCLERDDVVIVALAEFDQKVLLDKTLVGATETMQEEVSIDFQEFVQLFYEPHRSGGFISDGR